MSQGHSVTLFRDGPGTAWGFRLQGGRDLGQPLAVQRVNLGSPSEGELRKGDVLVRIGNKEAAKLTHQQAHDLIKNQGNNISLVIHRGPYQPQSPDFSSNSYGNSSPVDTLPKTHFADGRPHFRSGNLPVTQFQKPVSESERERIAITNQPHRTFPLIQPGVKLRHDLPTGSYLRHVNDPFVRTSPPSSMRGHPLVYQANEYLMKTKIQETVTNAASNSSSIGSPVRCRSETPESGCLPAGVAHRQYNSPIYLYSAQNVATSIQGQTGVPVTPGAVSGLIQKAVLEFAQGKSVPSGPIRIMDISKSPTFQTIYEDEWKELRKDQLREHLPVENKVKTIPPLNPYNAFGGPRDRISQSKTFEMINDTLLGQSSY